MASTSVGLSKTAHNAGVRVKDTNIDKRIAVAEAMPNASRYCPICPVMKMTGRKITTSDNVVRDHRQSDFRGGLGCRLARRHAFFLDIPENVFQNDNGVVDHDSCRQ